MSGWRRERTPEGAAKSVIGLALFALLLVAAVPVALLAGLILTVVGHVVLGLALFGASVLAAVVTVAVAGLNGKRQFRKLLSSIRISPLDGRVAQPEDVAPANVVHLDRSDYNEVR